MLMLMVVHRQQAYRERQRTAFAKLEKEIANLQSAFDKQKAKAVMLEAELEQMQRGVLLHLATAHGVDTTPLVGMRVTYATK
jgi:predicted RNase H-like nuclease (RuvC/YqgF family)